jgi:hypothetical protein
MKFENKMYGKVFALFDEYPYNIKSANIFSILRGLWEKFLKLLVQVMISVNGMQIRGLSFLIRSLYLLTISERIIIAHGHTQWHTHTQTHTHTHTVRNVWMIGPAQKPLSNNTHAHKTEKSMPPTGFEPAIPANEWPQTHTLDHAATGIGAKRSMKVKYKAFLTFN